jgi:CubicO group peptidase (beta-lactamase class C family)
MTARLPALSALVLLCAACTTSAPPAPSPADYVGTYEDEPDHAIEVVAGRELFAVQDEARYRLQPAGVDQVRGAYGSVIRFPRDAHGQVTGYEQDGRFHRRLSTTISPATAALARPRPPDQDAAADYRYQVPVDLHDGIAVGDATASGLGADTARRIVAGVLDGAYADLHGVLLYRHGRLALEEYFYGYDIARPHQMRSATKSVVSALAGIAVGAGALPGADVPVLPRMTYAAYANPDPRKAAITLGNLLAMNSGLDCNDHSDTSPGRETVIEETPDWVKATLDLPQLADPGTHGAYCSDGVAVAGRLVENAVHTTLPKFAQAALFGPLGMQRSQWQWNYALTNANREYAQIHLRPRDMLKLGIVYANDGAWQGRQLIPATWVRASLTEQSRVDNTGYGWFWWRPWMNVPTPAGTRRVQLVAAQGNGGQKIYLVPEFDLVAVFTAGAYNANGTPPNRIMADIVLPALIAQEDARATNAKTP